MKHCRRTRAGIVVLVEAVALLEQPLDEHFDVAARPARHLVTDRLSLAGERGVAHLSPELAQFVPYDVPLAVEVASKPAGV